MTDGPTGDALSDALVGPAMRLVGGVRTWDTDEVEGAFRDALAALAATSDPPAATGGPEDHLGAARALAILSAAMVPWDRSPGDLLAWTRREAEFHRLVDVGIDPHIAADVCAGLAQANSNREG